jgi:hypothetical protein
MEVEPGLRASVAVGDQAALWLAQTGGHLECVHHKLRSQVGGELPTDDHAAVEVEYEGEVDEAVPGPEVGDVGDPLLVRPPRREVALQEVARPLERGLVRDRRPALLAAADSFEALGAYQSGDPVAADLDITTLELLPCLADAVDAPVALTGGVDLPDSTRSSSARRDGFRDLRA